MSLTQLYKMFTLFRQMKTFVYLVMSTLENDEESQKRGCVGILYFIGGNTDFDHELQSKMPRLLKWLPMRVVALHLCTDSQIFASFAPLLVQLMHRAVRIRLRIYAGM